MPSQVGLRRYDLTDDDFIKAFESERGAIDRAADRLGVDPNAVRSRFKRMRRDKAYDYLAVRDRYRGVKREFEVRALPADDVSVEDLVAHRRRQFEHKRKHQDAARLVPVRVKIDGPIGILHFGDPHVDDDGTDIGALEEHCRIVNETPGLFATCLGDIQNNWIGRLARLYGEQSTSAKQSWQLAEWFVHSIRGKWLYLVGGNHDCHDAETDCLTRRGWVKYDDIRDDDLVLSFVTDTGACEWTPILRRVVREHNAEIVEVETRSVNFAVTPNHRILLKDRDWRRDWREWKYVAADSLPARVALPVSAQRQGAGTPLSDAQIALAGWLLTDGSISWQGASPRVAFYQSKDGSEIERLLATLGLAHRHAVRHRAIAEVAGRALIKPALPQHSWTLTADASRRVLSWVPEKGRLPNWAHDLTALQFNVLLEAIVAGDGCWDGAQPQDRNVAVVHGTETFLSSLQAIAVQHGWYARMSIAREADHRLNLCRRKIIQFETKSATSRRAYRGKVWCLTVPHGNFMIRRNGAAHFSGNCWSGAGDPLKWISRQEDALYRASECRIELQLPAGQKPRINARHDFVGHSMWNPAHGPSKALMLGVRDHIAVAGDKHFSAYGVLKCPETGITMHAIRVATYKIFDRYAMERGFRDQNLSPCAVTVINTEMPETDPDYIKVFWTPEEGAAYLTFLRNRHAPARHSAAAPGRGLRRTAAKK